MSLEVGSVHTRLGFQADDHEATRYEKRVAKLRVDARNSVSTRAYVDADTRGADKFEERVTRLRAKTEPPVETQATVKADTREADRYQRRLRQVRTDAQRDVEARLGAKLDTREFNRFQKELDKAEARAQRRDAFKAALGARFDSRAFSDYEKRTQGASRDTNTLRRGLQGLTGAASSAGGAMGGGAGLAGRVGGLSGALGPLGALLLAMTPILIALSGAALALGSSLAFAAAGAAAITTGIAATAGPLAGIVTAVVQRVGLITDAYEALGKQQTKGAAQGAASAETQRTAAIAIRSAEQGLTDAHRQVQRAQDDLTDARFRARRELEDLTDAADRSVISEERAGIALREVVQRLADLEADPTATRDAIAAARNAVKAARLDLRDAQRDKRRADVDAKRGTDTIKRAEEQLADARRGRTRAAEQVRNAELSAAAATRQQGAAAQDAAEKLGKLTATERHLVTTARSFADSFRRTFAPATDAIFGGVDRGLQRIEPLMERYRDRLERIGAGIGSLFDRASRSLAGPEWSRALDKFVYTAEAVTKPLGEAFGSAMEVLRDVAVAALPYVREFARWLRDALGNLSDKTSDGEKLNDLIGRMVDNTKSWAAFMGAVADLLITVFNGGEKEGQGLLDTLTDIVKGWDEFLETEEGQEQLKQFFREAIATTKDFVQAIGWIAAALFDVSRWFFRLNDEWHDVNMAMNRSTLALAIWLRGAFVDVFDFILGGFTTILGAASTVASLLGRLPGGGRFRDIAKDIDGLRDSVDGFRDSMQASNDEMGRRQNIELLQDEVRTLKDRLGHLDKGTKDYRETAERLRSKQRQLNDAMLDAEIKGKRGARGPRALAASARGALGAVDAANEGIVESYNQIAKQLGDLKPLKFRATRKLADLADDPNGISDTPPVPGLSRRAIGGWVGGRGPQGPDDQLILAGRGEAVVNEPQQGPVEEGLALRSMFLGGPANLDELFAGSFATGGRVAQVRERADHLHRMRLPYKWGGGHGVGTISDREASDGLDCSGAVGYTLGIPARHSSGYASLGRPGDRGEVVVYSNAEHTFMRILGRFFGTSGFGHPSRGTGPAWFTVPPAAGYLRRFAARSIGADDVGTGSGATGMGDIPTPGIAGPDGMIRRMAQRAVRKLAAAANDKLATALDVEGQALGDPGQAASAARIRQWIVAGLKLARQKVTPGAIQTLFGRIMQESGGNPRAVNNWDSNAKAGDPSKGILQTIGSTFRAYMVKGHGDVLNPVDNIAAAVRYMLARYGRLVGASGQGYRRGGRVASRGAGVTGPPRFESGGFISSGTYRGLRKLQGRRVASYDKAADQLDRLQADYRHADRKFNLTDETLVDPDTGAVNTQAVNARVAELDQLLVMREAIEAKLKQMRDIIDRVQATYRTIISRLKKAMRRITRKTKGGRERRATYAAAIKSYEGELAEWGDKRTEVFDDWRDASLDVDETRAERDEVKGTTARPGPPADEPGTGASPLEARPPTAQEIAAAAAEQFAAFTAARADLFSQFGGNIARRGTDPFGTVTGQAAGMQFYGAAAAGDTRAFAAPGGRVTYIEQADISNQFPATPADGGTYAQQQARELDLAFG